MVLGWVPWLLGDRPPVPLPREHLFASQVPGVASLSGIKQTLPRSGARRYPCTHGTSPPRIPRSPMPLSMLGCGGAPRP